MLSIGICHGKYVETYKRSAAGAASNRKLSIEVCHCKYAESRVS